MRSFLWQFEPSIDPFVPESQIGLPKYELGRYFRSSLEKNLPMVKRDKSMRQNNFGRFLFFVPLFSIIFLVESGFGQDVQFPRSAVDTNFKFQVNISVGLLGLRTGHHATFIDENGFRYDVRSLLDTQGRKEIGLTNNQYHEILSIYRDVVEEIKDDPNRDPWEEDQSLYAKRFQAAQEKMIDLLSVEQRDQLTFYRHKKGIQEVGFAKYLTSSHFGKNQTTSGVDLKKIDELGEKISKKIQNDYLKMLVSANQLLIMKIPESNRKKFRSLFTNETRKTFLETDLFANPKGIEAKVPKRKKNILVRAAMLPSIQKKIKINKKQKSEIQILEQHQVDRLSKILSPEQLMTLRNATIHRDLQKFGTVQALSMGYLADYLGLTPIQSQKIFEHGLQANLKLMVSKRRIRSKVLREFQSDFPKSVQNNLQAFIQFTEFQNEMTGQRK